MYHANYISKDNKLPENINMSQILVQNSYYEGYLLNPHLVFLFYKYKTKDCRKLFKRL
jgi:hypothetical protein